MNPIQNMEKHKDQFTQNDRKIYNAILQQPEKVVSLSTSRFAESIDVSQPALTRFIKMLGYQKYNDFRSDITAWSATLNTISVSDSLPYFDRLRRLISEAEKTLTEEYLLDLAGYILSFKRIFATGIGKSQEAAHLLHCLLRKSSIFVTQVALDELNEVTDNFSSEDLLIVFSVSTHPEIMEKIKETDGKVLLITANGSRKYQEFVDRTVLLPYLPPDPETSSVSPILFSILVELLDSYIAKLAGQEE